MNDQTVIRSSLPVHPVPQEVMRSGGGLLRIEGLVQHPFVLDRPALARVPRVTLDEPFCCEEGWSVPGLRWRGVRLRDVLALAVPLSDARYVRVGAGNYVLPLPVSEAEQAVLCDELNNQPLEVEHGAPWRLVIPRVIRTAAVL